MTKTDELPRTFATLRFAGALLDPEHISAILPTKPKRVHRRGEAFEAGARAGTLRGRTGIWYTDTRELRSPDGIAHLRQIADLIGDEDRVKRLRDVLTREGAAAHVSWFWYGAPGTRPPAVPQDVRDAIARLAEFEIQYDTDPVPA